MAGISCASHLPQHGLPPVVFDKGREPGGDWCLGARVECAYASGTAIAEAVLGQWLA